LARLKTKYAQEVSPALQKQFNYPNVMMLPRLEKIVVNVGLGEAVQNAKAMDAAVGDIANITGQRPVVTKAKKSIATFKIREGMPIGCKVTLRGERMWDFLDKLVNVALPRVRDFRGVSPKAFDGRGNYALGLKEQLIFPEIDYDKVDKIRGMDIIIVTTANTDEESKALLKGLGMPFSDIRQ
jgi:large subunit ribosomal protein L5